MALRAGDCRPVPPLGRGPRPASWLWSASGAARVHDERLGRGAQSSERGAPPNSPVRTWPGPGWVRTRRLRFGRSSAASAACRPRSARTPARDRRSVLCRSRPRCTCGREAASSRPGEDAAPGADAGTLRVLGDGPARTKVRYRGWRRSSSRRQASTPGAAWSRCLPASIPSRRMARTRPTLVWFRPSDEPSCLPHLGRPGFPSCPATPQPDKAGRRSG